MGWGHRVFVSLALCALCACKGTSDLDWEITFEDDALRESTALVIARVHDGSCAGEVLYRGEFASDGTSSMLPKPKLPAGRYGLAAVARDAQCRELAEVCRELDLPADERITLRLATLESPRAACPAQMCGRGRCGDADADGWVVCGTNATSEECDCDDGDPRRHPQALDLCADGTDQDCDGADAACRDADGDGARRCSPSDVPGTCDCDDDDPAIGLGATDVCGNGVDEDCRGGDAPCDRDGDGTTATRMRDGRPDCDDGDPAVAPTRSEVCDGKDNDCDGLIDELRECGPGDFDNDGVMACSPTSTTACDCDDCNRGVSPMADEQCANGLDDDCAGGDDGCASDGDNDGFDACPSGMTPPACDCDESDPMLYPGAPLRCGTDAGMCGTPPSCATDGDRDGYARAGDCDDADAMAHPFATEICNGSDDDCDGTIDEMPMGPSICVRDSRIPACDVACLRSLETDPYRCGSCRTLCGDNNRTNQCVGGNCTCNGAAACVAPAICCGGVGCVTPTTNESHCGGCGRACGADADKCRGGVCVCGDTEACASGRLCCGGECIDVRGDVMNCGACGNACGPNGMCVNGACTCASPSVGDCNGDRGDGCEADLASNPASCGACGAACAPRGDSCSSGACRCGAAAECVAPRVCCGGRCTEGEADGGCP